MDQSSLFKQYEEVFKNEDESSEKKKGGFEYAYSPFALQDAVGERDVKKIWIEYTKLRLGGIEADDLIHKIVSKVRDMLAIIKGASKEDLNIKSDYPYNKSKRDAKNWKEEDLKKFYSKLISIYHRARMREEELDLGLESAILSV